MESAREKEARAVTRATPAVSPASAAASRPGCTAMSPWMIWQVRPLALFIGIIHLKSLILLGYFEDTTFFPKRMSILAEMMYT